MAALIVNLENNANIEQIISVISSLDGINSVELENGKLKSKTQQLLDKIEYGEYVSDDEYFASIPNFYEELNKDYDEVINTPADQRIRKIGWKWDV